MLAAVTVLLVAGELLSAELISTDTPVAPSADEVVVSLALVAPLAFGPPAPVAVFALVMAICGVQLAVTDHVLAADLAPLVALYYLIAHGPDRLKPIGLAVALAGGAVMSARSSFPGVLDGFVLGTAVVTAEVLLAALLADRRLSRHARLAEQAAIGAAQERARIARELHDVVAHSLAVMVAQADGGRYAAPADPDAATSALARIADTGRDALSQMRRLLGVLRADEAGYAPQPGAGELPALVGQLAATGLPVELDVEGRPRELPADVDVTVYRVAQEALTNVLKHADSPRRVEVVLRYLEQAVELTVRDDGRAVAAGDGRGQGLAGMRERVALQSGTLRAGPREGGGFELHARL